MKHILLIIAVSILSLNGNAQLKGVDFREAQVEGYYNFEVNGFHGQLIFKVDDNEVWYGMPYDSTPVGYKQCYSKLVEILIANDALRLPDQEFSLLPDNIEFEQFTAMSNAIRLGNAEVKRVWYINEWAVVISSSIDIVGINIFKY